MANPRDLAEQAFALLQDALRDSEARASDLDEQLKRKRAPKTKLEEQLDVLTHRLEKIETERAHWEHQAGHLEEVAEAERVKVAQLKKKLEIAESGPEKLTKKEVNYWRERAETFDSETQEYKDRLANLRRELMERDAQLSQLQNSPQTAVAAPVQEPAEQGVVTEELRHQIQQRDQWLADLRLELHDLRTQASGTPEPPLETLAEIETLRHQVTSLERALSEAHNTRAAAQADLHRAEQDLAARDRAVREAEAAGERAQGLVRERDHRLVELSAQFEQLRSESHQREHQIRAESAEHTDQIASLSRELMELRSRADHDRHAAANASREIDETRAARSAAEQRVTAVEAALERTESALAQRTHEHSEATAAVQRLEHRVAQREEELAERAEQMRELGQRLADREQYVNTLNGDLEHAKATVVANGREISSLRETLQAANRDLDEARGQVRDLEAAHADARDNANAFAAELAAVREQFASLEAGQAEARRQADGFADEVASAREQIAGLEAELKEEKEHAENLGELANERREHMTKLQEQLEEAEERFAEADWRLGKALYFEKLVKRRKGLIAKLLEALRGKMKANVALKAGLDGLRTYKASAEANQQKMLQRLDKLKAELTEAEDTIKKHQGATHTKEELAHVESRAADLETRLNTQAEIIQSLEAELKTARLAHHKGDDDASQQIEQLRAELETKNQIINKLQEDTDEQQRRLSKLRGSESETVRLKALTEKDRSEIDTLQREIAQLREALARQTAAAAASGSDNPQLAAMLKERDQTVTRLMGTIKEHEATIKKLNESADGWKRKYQFLAADEPDAYKSAAEH
jgi:chromosome segregation ATPase